ncbi:hypothetical protein HDU93_003485, partial [Gonapodya sp. JEL0774]
MVRLMSKSGDHVAALPAEAMGSGESQIGGTGFDNHSEGALSVQQLESALQQQAQMQIDALSNNDDETPVQNMVSSPARTIGTVGTAHSKLSELSRAQTELNELAAILKAKNRALSLRERDLLERERKIRQAELGELAAEGERAKEMEARQVELEKVKIV